VQDLFNSCSATNDFVERLTQALENHERNLWKLIREATEELDQEKRHVDELVNSLLPS